MSLRESRPITGTYTPVQSGPSKLIEVFINGRPVHVPSHVNLVEASRLAGVYVPTLCYHPRLQPIGKCGLCCVEVEGGAEPVLGCSAHVVPGMKILTDTPACRARAALAMSRIVNKVRARQPETYKEAPELEHLVEHTMQDTKDHSSHAIDVDMTKCVECTRCVRVCRDVQGLGIWKMNDGAIVPVSTTSGAPLGDTLCVSCGQCSAVCPSGALTETMHLDLIRNAAKEGKILVAQIAPSVRVAIGEEFGKPAGSISTGKLVMALKRAGFHFVFDTNYAADLTIMEEGTEFAGRLTSATKGPFPMFSTCCPCWINLLEKEYPHLIPHMSTCKSPQGMLGALLKTYWAQKINKRPEDIYSVSIMPCTAKKDECLREATSRGEYQDVDYVMTTRETAHFLKEAGITKFDLELPFDPPFHQATGAGAIFGATGGVTEAVLRTAAEKVTGEKLEVPCPQMKQCRGFEGVKTIDVTVAGLPIRIGVVHGIANVKRFIAEMEKVGAANCGYHFVEVMACPGGCIGGGGQPKSNDPEILVKRSNAIYEVDERSAVRRSHENVTITALYKEFIGEPNGERAHHLLHTHYHKQEVKARELAARPAAAAPIGSDEGNVVAVLYATVGGNTEGVARGVFNTLRAAKINAKLWPMDACSPADLASIPTALVFTSTFGDGERPPQAQQVWEWLDGQHDHSALKNLSFAVFGLGSKKYSRFNQAAKEFDNKLMGLGAKPLVEVGLGDDMADDGVNTALEPWLGALYEELGVEPPKTALVPAYRVVVCLEPSRPVPPPTKTMYAKVTETALATPPEYGRPIRYMEFDLSQTGYKYEVGDALGIHPQNPAADVTAFLKWYGIAADAIVSVVPVGDAAPLPIPAAISVQHLFERYLDIFSRPRKLFFRQLAKFAQDAAQRQRLEFLASKEGADALAAYLKDCPSYADVLQDFPSAHPTLDFLLDMLPLVRVRLYSVASAPSYVGEKVQLLIAIPTEVSRSRGKIKGGGLATSWLPTLKVNEEVPVVFHEGSLRPPVDAAAPMLMCGLGTGLAPMRALLQHRLHEHEAGKKTGQAVLYQACRHAKQDYICQAELDAFKKAGVLTQHIGSFSHDDPKKFETADVKMAEDPRPIWEVLQHPNAVYYYCGPAAFNIPTKLEEAIKKAIVAAGKVNAEYANNLVEKMKGDKRWLVEAF